VLATDRAKKILGIAVSERGLLLAEAAVSAKGPQVLRTAEFAFPAGVTLDQGQALGAALREFLDRNGFSSHRAVIGVPARWLVLRPHSLPPADQDTAIAMLLMHAHAKCPPELGEVVFDFAGQSDPAHGSNVLLMGLSRKWMDRLSAMTSSAGLKIAAVTPCATALGAATAQRLDSPLMMSLRPDGAELIAHEGQQTCYLRHLGSAVSGAPLTIELRRAAATLPNGWAASNGDGHARPQVGAPRTLVLWDDVGMSDHTLDSLRSALDMPVTRGDLALLGGNGAATSGSQLRSSAIALTLAPLGGRAQAIDFLRPRLNPPKPRTMPRPIVWGSIAAAIIVLLLVGMLGDLALLDRQISKVDKDLNQLEPKVAAAKPFVAAMQFAEAFHPAQPDHLACLRDITESLPPEGQAYLTGFHLAPPPARAGDQRMIGDITGRADTVDQVRGLATKMKAAGRFSDIHTQLDSRESHSSGPGVSYTIRFAYLPGKSGK
jgi:hypothetical protein